jgi:hypothetical protein
MKALLAIAIMLLPGVAWAGGYDETAYGALPAETGSSTISYEGCLSVIGSVSGQFSVPPTNVVETSDLRIVKWFLPDGNVMVACSRPDRKMVVTRTAN